jgi:hypothetical protein
MIEHLIDAHNLVIQGREQERARILRDHIVAPNRNNAVKGRKARIRSRGGQGTAAARSANIRLYALGQQSQP